MENRGWMLPVEAKVKHIHGDSLVTRRPETCLALKDLRGEAAAATSCTRNDHLSTVQARGF